MPNLAATLKHEIRRLARKEIRAQVMPARRAASHHRREIARLKRLLRLQERSIAALQTAVSRGADKTARAASAETGGIPAGARYSARSVRAQRRRLKLSAEQYGQLVGVTGQTIYLWEQGKTRPAKAQLAALVAARALGRREARKRLEGLRS
jgi:DNA-binding transcriptional regulator YiaG